jgi:bacteriorhodopsin
MAALLQAGAIGSGRIWLLLGIIGMALGSAYFIGTGRRETHTTMRRFYTVITAASIIATIAYLVMALGYGDTSVTSAGETYTVYWIHYVSWVLTTPLILFALALVAEGTRRTIAALVGFDVSMVLLGLVTALTGRGLVGLDTQTLQYVLLGASFVAYLAVFGLLVRPLSREAAQQSPEVAMLFSMLRNIVIVLWVFYPIVWLLGPPVIGLIPTAITLLAFLVLDLLVKIGFGVLLLRSDSVLEQTEGTLAGPTAD